MDGGGDVVDGGERERASQTRVKCDGAVTAHFTKPDLTPAAGKE